MAAHQRARGVHIAAVLSPADAARSHPFISRLESLGIPFTAVVVGSRSYLREYRTLKDLYRTLRPKLVHTHGYHADIVAGAAARALRFPRVSTVHGFLGVPLRNHVYEALQLLTLPKAQAVIAVSRPLAERVARSGVARGKIHCIPNGFVPPRDLRTRDAAREKLGLNARALTVGWVGRLSHEKGPDVMLESLARTTAPWELSMIGEGPENASLRGRAKTLRISDRVRWHGGVEGAGQLLRAFDAFVLSSRTEGTPIALLEAMYAEVPIVAAAVGGVPDVVGPAEALIVPSEQPEAIAQALEQLAASPEAARARTTLARERVLTEFSAERWMASIQNVYDGIKPEAHRKGR